MSNNGLVCVFWSTLSGIVVACAGWLAPVVTIAEAQNWKRSKLGLVEKAVE